MESTHNAFNACNVTRQMDEPWNTVRKIVRKGHKFYLYKIKHAHKQHYNDPTTRESFAFEFFAWMEVNIYWPWNILWTNEARFYEHGYVNTHNCRILVKEILHVIYPVPVHSSKVNIWCGMASSFKNGPIFFDEQSPGWHVAYTVTATCLESIIRRFVILLLQQCVILDATIFIPNGAWMHIGTCVTQLLKKHFTNERITVRNFSTSWISWSLGLESCIFWL